ncbi:MAG: hypothetical protein CL913_02445, partial [Deltaproteobacteria bacterium]|nr:hypothetical protein [Deltaproteobacteria bacterium]
GLHIHRDRARQETAQRRLMILRGGAMAMPVATGVFIGQFLFRPSAEKYYKPFCQVLLLVLATVSLFHTLGFIVSSE